MGIHLENCKFCPKKHEKNEDIASKLHEDNEVLLFVMVKENLRYYDYCDRSLTAKKNGEQRLCQVN